MSTSVCPAVRTGIRRSLRSSARTPPGGHQRTPSRVIASTFSAAPPAAWRLRSASASVRARRRVHAARESSYSKLHSPTSIAAPSGSFHISGITDRERCCERAESVCAAMRMRSRKAVAGCHIPPHGRQLHNHFNPSAAAPQTPLAHNAVNGGGGILAIRHTMRRNLESTGRPDSRLPEASRSRPPGVYG